MARLTKAHLKKKKKKKATVVSNVCAYYLCVKMTYHASVCIGRYLEVLGRLCVPNYVCLCEYAHLWVGFLVCLYMCVFVRKRVDCLKKKERKKEHISMHACTSTNRPIHTRLQTYSFFITQHPSFPPSPPPPRVTPFSVPNRGHKATPLSVLTEDARRLHSLYPTEDLKRPHYLY